jgi:hypothetical protein
MHSRAGSAKERRRVVAFILGSIFGIARIANLAATRPTI